MITEIAQIDVKPGTEKDFEEAVAKARPLFLRAKGGRGSSSTGRSRSHHAIG
jgi:heme-degrading monooxygenase HmoA